MSDSATEAFFAPIDETRWFATAHTVGPWDPRFQHGGPPSALLVRAMERLSPDPDAMISRVCIEILGPIPTGEIEINAGIVRPGRSVQLLEATLSAGGRDAVRATAWQLKRNASAEVSTGLRQAPPLPDEPDEHASPPGWTGGYLEAMHWYLPSGGFDRPGPAVAWARQRIPLVAGEQPTGLQRLLAVADSGNGVSWSIDMGKHTFMNTDLTVHVFREPVGEWICLDAQTAAAPGGVGLATSVLSDASGPLGVGAQSLFIGVR